MLISADVASHSSLQRCFLLCFKKHWKKWWLDLDLMVLALIMKHSHSIFCHKSVCPKWLFLFWGFGLTHTTLNTRRSSVLVSLALVVQSSWQLVIDVVCQSLRNCWTYPWGTCTGYDDVQKGRGSWTAHPAQRWINKTPFSLCFPSVSIVSWATSLKQKQAKGDAAGQGCHSSLWWLLRNSSCIRRKPWEPDSSRQISARIPPWGWYLSKCRHPEVVAHLCCWLNGAGKFHDGSYIFSMFCLAFLGLRCVRWCAASGGHGVAAFGRNQGTGTWTGVWYPRSINICHSNFLSNLEKDTRASFDSILQGLVWWRFLESPLVSYTLSPVLPDPGAHLRLGFVMCNVPEQLPGVVKLLAESPVLKTNILILMPEKVARIWSKVQCCGPCQLIYIDILDLAYLNPTWLL